MGRKKQKKTGSADAGKKQEEKKANKRSTLEEVEAVSSSDEGSVEQNNQTWNKQAEALKEKLKSGAFDSLLSGGDAGDDDDSIEEVELGDEQEGSDDEEIDATKAAEKGEEQDEESGSGSEVENDPENDDNDGEEEEEDAEEEEEEDPLAAVNDTNSKALLAKTEEMLAAKRNWPWVERFDVTPPTPLPFGTIDEQTGTKVDVHDDLKREVAFYDLALEAVHEARMECKEAGVPFSRPDDFFAEMVKTDGKFWVRWYPISFNDITFF